MTNLINAEYRIGLTGTLSGAKTHQMVLEGLFGPVRELISTKKLMERKELAELEIKCIILHYPTGICKEHKDDSYPKELHYLVKNEKRNNFIQNLAVSLRENTLILYQFVEKHGIPLFDELQAKIASNPKYAKRKLFMVHGNIETAEREEIRAAIEKEKDAIACCSFGTYSRGINIINLRNLIFGSPYKSRIRNLQSIGRVLRPDGDKVATLFDIVDDLRYKSHENFALRHFKTRLQIYMQEKFRYKMYHVNLYDGEVK